MGLNRVMQKSDRCQTPYTTEVANSLTVSRWVSTVPRRFQIDSFADSIAALVLPRSSARFEISVGAHQSDHP